MDPSSAAEESFVFPMSFAQQRLWLLDQREGGSAFYNIPAALRLRGRLDVDVLARALNEIVARHESLRTNLASEDDAPVQIIRSAAQLSVPVVEADSEGAVLRLIEQTIAEPFDLARDLLVRVRLIRLGVEAHVLVLAVHHIVADGWSVGVFVREFSTLYTAFAAGQPSPLPELPIQYADFSEWQREWLQGRVLTEQLDYWRKQLAGAPDLTTFPADRRRPPVLTYRGASQRFAVPATTVAGVKELARAADLSLFMVLLAALAIELARYTSNDDIIIGSPIANRSREEIEGLIGFFVNTLVLRIDLKGNPSIRTVLDRARQTALAAYAHQDLPFERLIEEVQPARSLSFAPFFQVMFTLHAAAGAPLSVPGLAIEPVAFERAATLYDLTLSVEETEDGRLAARIEYNTDLFDVATVEGIARHYRVLLDEMAADPSRPIAQLPLLDAEQRTRQLAEFNAPRSDTQDDAPVHRLFEEQAARSPDAPALSCGARQFSYVALNRWANRLAHALIARGVGPGVLVGILIERSPEAIAAILATLKAGGAYVPLDPAYPEERLKAMVAEAGFSHLVTRRSLLDRLSRGMAEPLLIDEIEGEKASNPTGSVPPAAPAYVIFTSGSTGRPKLAAVQHRGLSALVGWFCREFGFDPEDSNLLLTSLSFDLTQKNIFAPLVTGGCIELYPDEEYDPDRITDILAARRVTWVNCTPSMFYPLVTHDDGARLGALATLRAVFLGGEPIVVNQFERWRQSGFGNAEIVNTYGPTECTDVTAFHRLGEAHAESGVPIGKPVDKTCLYILDGGLELLPQGAIGELCIAGDSVGPGYLNDVRATADRFCPDPYASEPGARLYRTGDLVRYLRDGAILFVGRIDHQVKIRGHRVEPGEAEAMLAAHPEVADAAIVVREDEAGEKRLIAYYAGTADPAELAAYLRSRLPNYLLPATITVLDAMPLTPSGKVDRRALPAPDASEAPKLQAEPRTESERVLMRIWQEVLMRPAIGIHDNFFELGGHSLLATQVVSRLRRTFHVDMPMRAIFECPTIAEFADRVDRAQLAQADRTAIEAALQEIEGRQVAK
ncbi:MAG TPA: amino acid adenylation domain-containing protein [Stellaceae bacterium]